MSRTCFRVNPHSIVAWMSRNSLLEAGAKSEGEVTATGLEPRTTYFLNEHSTIWLNWLSVRLRNKWFWVWVQLQSTRIVFIYLFFFSFLMSDCTELTVNDYMLLEFCVLVCTQFLTIIFHICCFIVSFIVNVCKDPWYRYLKKAKKREAFISKEEELSIWNLKTNNCK